MCAARRPFPGSIAGCKCPHLAYPKLSCKGLGPHYVGFSPTNSPLTTLFSLPDGEKKRVAYSSRRPSTLPNEPKTLHCKPRLRNLGKLTPQPQFPLTVPSP
jgi:hypothetical protein